MNSYPAFSTDFCQDIFIFTQKNAIFNRKMCLAKKLRLLRIIVIFSFQQFKFLRELAFEITYKKIQKWSLIPSHIDCLLKIHVIATDRDYQRLGISSKLLFQAFKEGLRLGCQGVVSEITSYKSQRVILDLFSENFSPK